MILLEQLMIFIVLLSSVSFVLEVRVLVVFLFGFIIDKFVKQSLLLRFLALLLLLLWLVIFTVVVIEFIVVNEVVLVINDLLLDFGFLYSI